MTPEGRIESYLTSQCKKRDILHYKFTSPSNSGVPDRILIANHHTWFVELKAPGEVPRKLQEVVMAKMRNKGATIYVADSKEMVDFILSKILEDT